MALNNQILVHHLLECSAHYFPDKTAVIQGDVRRTYFSINQHANWLAHWLLQSGTTPGERIALLCENSAEYIICYYGILKAGAVAVPVNTEVTPNQLIHILSEIENSTLVISSRFERLLRRCPSKDLAINQLIVHRPKLDWSGSAFKQVSLQELFEQPLNSDNLSRDITPQDLAAIIYTSGSTGTPKGVMLSHQNIVTNVHSICSYLELTEKDIQMVVLPFHYVMGKSLLNSHFAVGGTVVINNQFAYPASVIQQMTSLGVTGFSGVPSTYAYLLYRSPLKKLAPSLTSLRYCSQAGGHMSDHLKRELRQVLPEWTEIFIMYGATEAAARLTYLDPQYFESKMGSIGKPIPNVSLNVLDSQGNHLPSDETGELVAQGANIMQGYWKDPEGSSAVLTPKGYHTGDMGYYDADGFFYVTGRRDNIIKVSGHRINPQEIEDVLLSSGVLAEAAVLSQPDELLGNRLVALVSPIDDDCAVALLEQFCGQRLPTYKRPSTIQLINTLPKNTSGKIDKNKCLAIINTP